MSRLRRLVQQVSGDEIAAIDSSDQHRATFMGGRPMKCPSEWVTAAAEDRLPQQHLETLAKHLSICPKCCRRLDEQTAPAAWWSDASRFLDESVLADPLGDASDSSSCDSRLFDDDDPINQLRSLGAIESASHPEMLGQLGRYTIEREIGSGGMGVVVKAHDSELNRVVAIKVLAPHLARSGTAKQRFIREGRAAAAVVHENVVAIHEVNTVAALPYLVMRYVDGISLQRHVDLYGPLSVFDALRIASQTANGLAAAHRQGIIHRDVKPANILVNHSCSRTWISDFGLARAVDDASLTRTGFIAGTPHYMSPEQARGGDVGPQSDLFSLGAVMYFMFTGRPPWRAERSLAVLHRIVSHPHRPLWKSNAQIPDGISDLVDRMLSKNVDDRPVSATDVQVELEKALSELQNPESHPVLATTQRISPKPAWWSRPWFVAPTVALITAFICLNLARQSEHANNPPPDGGDFRLVQKANEKPNRSAQGVAADEAPISPPSQVLPMRRCGKPMDNVVRLLTRSPRRRGR